MAVAKAKVPPDLAREFEALGEPVVTHRLTRFKDARLREAAHLWLAQRAERDAVRRAAETQRASRRYRRFLVVATAIGIIGWAIAIAVILR